MASAWFIDAESRSTLLPADGDEHSYSAAPFGRYVLRCGLKRHTGDVSKHQCGASQDDLQIGARHIGDAVGGAFNLFSDRQAGHSEVGHLQWQ